MHLLYLSIVDSHWRCILVYNYKISGPL